MKLAEFQKVGKMLAKEHKITIEEGEGWAANIKKREVYYRKEDIYNLSEEHILGLTLHEVAHIHYTTDTAYPRENEELIQSTMNMLEDISIEHIISKDYPNAGEILESTRTECLDTLVKMLPKMNNVSLHEKSLLYAATRFEGRGYKFNLTDYEKLGDEIAQIMIKQKSNIYNRKETKDLLPLALEIVKLLVNKAGKPTEQQRDQMRQGGTHGQAQRNTENETGKQKIIEGLKASNGWELGQATSQNVAFVDEISDQAAAIGKQLRSVLKRNNAMEFGGRYRTGKLMAKRFVRIKALKDRRPFARRIVKSNQSYAFAIASDVSGSMFGGSNHIKPGSYALSSLHMVGEALRQANIPRSMIIFGDEAVVVAPMSKAQIGWAQLASQQSFREAHTGGTDIAAAIKMCTKELAKVRAERKIMIVLTDGSSDMNQMVEAHKEAIKAGIEPLGITLQDQSYAMNTTFGKDKNTEISDTRQVQKIGKAFIDILKKSIKSSPV